MRMIRRFPAKGTGVLVGGGAVGLILIALSIGLPSWPLEASAGSNSLSLTRAELDRGRLRIEGENAGPNASISVDGVVMGTADAQGRFRVEADGFSPAGCQVTVSDGVRSIDTLLSGCSAGAPPPPLPPPGTGFSFISVAKAQLDGGRLRIEGEGAIANGTIFIDGVAMATADEEGRFRVERVGFNPSSCDVNVSDGLSSTVVTFDPCTVPPKFMALEVELLEGPLGVPATLHTDPRIDSTQVPADLPQGSIVSFEIEGVVQEVDGPRLEWQIGSLPLFVYAGPGTRFDDAPQSGDLVRVGAVRTRTPGPLVAERIRQRQPGPLPVGPAQAEIAFLFSGILQSEANNVLTVGGVRFATTALTEVDPAVGDGDAVLVVFLPVGVVP